MLIPLLASLIFASSSHGLDLLAPHDRTRAMQQALEVKPSPGETWLGVVGDSSVTGAAASSSTYYADWWELLTQVFDFALESQRTVLPARFADYPTPQEFNITDPVEPATRVLYSQSEFEAAAARDGIVQINLEAKASLRLDTPEYAFGYMVGRALGVPAAHIVNTGQDGKRINTMGRQFRRLFEVDAPTLPPLVLVSYVANDFCHPNNFTRPVTEFRAEYDTDVRAALAEVAKLSAAPQGTDIVILAPLDVANILTNPKVLAQKVRFQGGVEVTCGDLRSGAAATSGRLSLEMSNTLIGECKGVLTPSADPVAHLARVRELQQTQVEVLTAAIADFNHAAAPGLKARLATSVREIDFQNGDLAGDCFHPSVNGHSRIARQLLAHELKDWRR